MNSENYKVFLQIYFCCSFISSDKDSEGSEGHNQGVMITARCLYLKRLSNLAIYGLRGPYFVLPNN